jgi:hypothetical protein
VSVDVSTATREDVLAAQAIVDMLAGTGVVVEESVKALAELDPMAVAPKADDVVKQGTEVFRPSSSWAGNVHHIRGAGEGAKAALIISGSELLDANEKSQALLDMLAGPYNEVAEMNRQSARSYRRVVEGIFMGDGAMASSFVAGLTPKDKALLAASLDASE